MARFKTGRPEYKALVIARIEPRSGMDPRPLEAALSALIRPPGLRWHNAHQLRGPAHV
ncbi:hypothetical protein ACOXXX_17945 [Thalassococcus sp. BH17M4-6]|uniref:hypothetical protein n=1 Tax=Thalassococcus sp. BH17M4-6 TaxID=3413148 RepID=UPI003BD82BF8